jgi:two-component system, sensor histidine kinase PdtaS
MASLAELARQTTDLEPPEVAHLQRLVASWGLVADFCFADLLLLAPVRDSAESRYIVLGQIRPTTSQTLYRDDWLGRVVDEVDRPLLARAFRLGQIIEGEMTVPAIREVVRIQCIPVNWKGRLLAVLTRESAPIMGRQHGELERAYVEIYNRLARMIVSGEFPFPTGDAASEVAPRVGDGVMVLDETARVSYASPNAVSALHRMGVHANTEGMRLGEAGLDESPVRDAYAIGAPVTSEMEPGNDVTVILRCIPLLEHGTVTGGVVLMRDISELRRRDRMLLSKDATIREIHHRVKNNLQTVSALLRLQARRLESEEAKAAVEESVRRIRSIALVHDILSREPGQDVPFVEIVRPLVRMVEEGLLSPERPVLMAVHGDAGHLPPTVATPLAVVLAELLQNAVEHGFPEDAGPVLAGHVTVALERHGNQLVVRVTDDGAGLPEGFSVETAAGLGLSIVRTLVTTELGGSITVDGGELSGTVVELRVPVDAGRAA